MRRRERGPGVVGWLAVGAALLGAATFAAKLRQGVPVPALGLDHDEATGRGRPAMPPSPDARRAGHETEDMRGGLMGKLVLLLGSVAVCMVLAMVGLRYWVTQAHLADQPKLTALQTQAVTPPLPHLQTDPVDELAAFRRDEDKRLNGYGYTDDTHAHAHIPIARAMALTVGQDLGPPP